ncbi:MULTISPECIES: DNA mismatch repair endonuclease MutL [unclassified Jeotgalibaca]|uniref:DNA mismatch repair endonuclease MutL n=1 Tax=unclassified Jeotgalibaca TaxID=2621505 RepID=UPI003FD134F0
MATIKTLSEQLSNQIAAGEVIERPSSVVKELVENAIDAGSSQIDILIEEAGLKKIMVSDNGGGIHPDEVVLAFERHATSKIYTTQDLFRIHSLGFRGEALPSIASVSKLTLESATIDLPGKYIRIEGGNIVEEKIHGARKGTTLTVESLFYNTPARLKYIRTLQTELASISDIVNRLALSHPKIAFRLVNEGNQMLRTSGNGDLKQAIAGVYGTAVARKMLHIEAEDLDFKLSGYVSKPELTRASRNYMTFILNGRYIRNYNLQKALVEGFGSRLMIGRFPVAVITVDTDPLLLDVNVHPSKKEIRISKETELSALIIKAVQAAMKEVVSIPSGLENLSFKRNPVQVEQHEQIQVELESPKFNYESPKVETQIPGEQIQEAFGEVVVDEEDYTPPTTHDASVLDAVKNVENEEETIQSFPELYYFGQMHGTYLFAQNDKGLYMIDQHAAQERIKYEFYRDEIARVANTLQSLLVPITIDLTSDEFLKINDNHDKLEEIGIYLEPFGKHTFLLSQHPTWFKPGQEEGIVNDIIQMVLSDEGLSVKKLREATAIMMSCKRSIKANHHLPDYEARQLLADLAKTKNPYNCPHGRPVLIHFSNTDMEKMFKRIQDAH